MQHQNLTDLHPSSEANKTQENEIVSSKKVRGKGAKPALAHVNLRLPVDVFEFYKKFPNSTGKMREVLSYFAQVTQQFDGASKDSDNIA